MDNINFFNTVLDWFRKNGDFSAVIASLLGTIITFIYVRLTYKMVQQPYSSVLTPIGIDRQDAQYSYNYLSIKNFGNGLALNVEVALYTTINNDLKNKTVKYKLKFDGVMETSSIESNAVQTFSFDGTFVDYLPILITSKTVTGKKEFKAWEVMDWRGSVVPINRFGIVKCHIKWWFKQLKKKVFQINIKPIKKKTS